MSLRVTCKHGHTLKVRDELAGRSVRCPKCQAPVLVPAAEPVSAAEDLTAPETDWDEVLRVQQAEEKAKAARRADAVSQHPPSRGPNRGMTIAVAAVISF